MFKQIALIFSLIATATATEFESPAKTRFIELYSSQGCSSCPPAEHWIGQLEHDKELWKTNIPIVFHVDYWDYLGWKDPFASKEYTNRQRKYGETNAVSQIYTPGFVVNGKEWRDYFRGRELPPAQKLEGKIKVEVKDRQVTVTYDQSMKGKVFNAQLVAHAIETKVLRGENGGRRLTDDFIAFQAISDKSEQSTWSFTFPKASIPTAQKFALIVWVEDKKSQQPLQAAGSWIKIDELHKL